MGAHVRSFFMEPNQYNKKWIKKFCQVERGCTVLTAIFNGYTLVNEKVPTGHRLAESGRRVKFHNRRNEGHDG